jgi:hypothetical protein
VSYAIEMGIAKEKVLFKTTFSGIGRDTCSGTAYAV